jgi:hypothetical protein
MGEIAIAPVAAVIQHAITPRTIALMRGGEREACIENVTVKFASAANAGRNA